MDYGRVAPYGPRPDLTDQIRAFQDSSPHGWCSREKAHVLCRLVTEYQPAFCVEIGVFGGASLIPIGLALRDVGEGLAVGIDPWSAEACLEGMIEEVNRDWWGSKIDLPSIKRSCEEHIARLDLGDWVKLVQDKSENVVFNRKIDLLHLDGNHSEVASVRDVEKWLPQVNDGGHVVFDDVNWTEGGQRTQARAVSMLLEKCQLAAQIDNGHCIVLRKGRPPEPVINS